MKFTSTSSLALAYLFVSASVVAARHTLPTLPVEDNDVLVARDVAGLELEERARTSSSGRSRRQNFRNGGFKGNNGGNNNGGNNNAANKGSLTLQANLVQTASQKTGLEEKQDAGTVSSATDNANFINFCKDFQPITNGQQIKTGSCNGIPQGRIPAVDKVPAVRFKVPANGQNFEANKDFTVELQVKNLNTGAFTNPTATYFAAPANLDGQGIPIGHDHVTIQRVNSATSTEIPDTQDFAFFKGLNGKAANGILSTVVTGGLAAGTYRCCSITSSANHAVINGPVAQRGSIEDCTIFTVGGGNAGNNGGNNNAGGNNGGAQNGNGNNGGNGKRCDAKRLARKRALAEKKRELASTYFDQL